MEFDRRGLHAFEASRKHLAQAIVVGTGAAVLHDNTAKGGKCPAFFEPEHCERHVTDEPFRPKPGEIGKVGLGHLVIELRIDTLWHEDLFSQEVMRFSHLPLGQQNMPHMEQNKVQFGLNRQAMRVKDGMMRMMEGAVYRIVSTKNARCSLTFTALQCSQLLC